MRIDLKKSVELLKAGRVVAIPTETVYGLGACINFPEAVESIFTLKGRPQDNPLIIHLAEARQLDRYVLKKVPDLQLLTEVFWPGPLTLVAPIKTDRVPSSVRAGLPTAAFRVPMMQTTRDVIKKTGPLVMPSANLSGSPSATHPMHVESDFGQEFPVLDGGFCSQGVESTILHYGKNNKWEVLRLGALPAEAFIDVLGYRPEVIVRPPEQPPICPGQKYRHYAPQATLHLCLSQKEIQGSPIIGYEDRTYPENAFLVPLGRSTDPETVARNLYSALRTIDDKGYKEAWIDLDVPHTGLWLTIIERLQKASQ